MGQTRIDQDLHVAGTLTAKTFNPPASSITNAAIITGAGVDTSKLDHRHRKHYSANGTAASVTVPIHLARAAGVVNSIEAGSIAACVGAATITIDLRKNGSTILTSVITLDNANTARVLETGAINTATYADGDFFELVIVATAGGGTLGTGLMVDVEFDEEAS